MPKISGVQTRTVSRFPLGSPGTKGHLDVAPMEWRKVYYMGEGGGFPQARAVVSHVSPKLPVACLSTKGVPKCELTNLLVGLMQVRVSEYLVPLPSLIPEPQHAFLPLLVLRAKNVPELQTIPLFNILKLIFNLTRSLRVHHKLYFHLLKNINVTCAIKFKL
jgi:hypothetical protein